MTIEAVHQTWVISITLFHKSFESSHWLDSSAYMPPTYNVEYLVPPNWTIKLTEVSVLFTSLQNIVILSVILIVYVGVKSADVVCPVHILERTTFVSLRFSRKRVLWTLHLYAANHRYDVNTLTCLTASSWPVIYLVLLTMLFMPSWCYTAASDVRVYCV